MNTRLRRHDSVEVTLCDGGHGGGVELHEGDAIVLPRDLDPGDVAVEAEQAVQRPARRDGRREVAHHQHSVREEEGHSVWFIGDMF